MPSPSRFARCFAIAGELFVETHPWASCGSEELAAHLAPAGLTPVESVHEQMLQRRR